MSGWSEACAALGVLATVSLSAVEPTPVEAWFAVDYATGYADGATVADWSASNGTWSLGASDGSCSFVRGDEPYVALNAVTNGYLDFTPTVPAETNVPEVVTFRSEMRPYSSRVALPDLSVSGARGAVLAANRPPRGFVFFGWTKSGWEELAGVEVREDEMQEVCVEIDTSVQPPVVSYRVDGARLVSATNAAVTCFEAGAPAAKGGAVVSVGGSGRLGTFSATRESAARTAAVVKGDGTSDYFATLSEACAAAQTGGRGDAFAADDALRSVRGGRTVPTCSAPVGCRAASCTLCGVLASWRRGARQSVGRGVDGRTVRRAGGARRESARPWRGGKGLSVDARCGGGHGSPLRGGCPPRHGGIHGMGDDSGEGASFRRGAQG